MTANIKIKGATLRAAPSLRRGTKQIRTAVAGFADLCLATRPWYPVFVFECKGTAFSDTSKFFVHFFMSYVWKFIVKNHSISGPFSFVACLVSVAPLNLLWNV